MNSEPINSWHSEPVPLPVIPFFKEFGGSSTLYYPAPFPDSHCPQLPQDARSEASSQTSLLLTSAAGKPTGEAQRFLKLLCTTQKAVRPSPHLPIAQSVRKNCQMTTGLPFMAEKPKPEGGQARP